MPGIHESIGRKVTVAFLIRGSNPLIDCTLSYFSVKTCTNVSRMNGPSNHTATIISNGKKNRKIKTKSNLKVQQHSDMFITSQFNFTSPINLMDGVS